MVIHAWILTRVESKFEGWSGSYENMKEEEQNWYELNRVEEREDQDDVKCMVG
jgi:hypothetical protein